MIHVSVAIKTGLFFLMICNTSALKKKWISSWDFSDTKNWKDGAAPCSGRPTLFQTTPEYFVYLDSNSTMKSLTFPQDSRGLILGNEVTLTLSEETPADCIGKRTDSIFMNKAPGWWWDPDSWECQSNRVWECNSAVPDLHRVPCIRDTVEIPHHAESLYRIMFSYPTPTIQSLSIGNKNLTTSQFTSFAESDDGRGRISSTSSSSIYVYIEENEPCRDITGCLCHKESPREEICRIRRNKCPPTKWCSTPIKMEGFCCDLCGVEVTISHNGSLQLSIIEALLGTISDSPEGKNIDVHVAKMNIEFFHVYFLPKNDFGDYTEAASSFVTLFQRDYNKNGKHKLLKNVAKGSIAVQRRNEKAESSRVVTGILTTIFLTLAIAFAYVIYRNRRKYEAHFSFRKFSLHGRRESTLLGPSTAMQTYFQNPTYKETESTSSSLNTISETTEAQVEISTRRENPLYKVYEGVQSSSSSPKATVEVLISTQKENRISETHKPETGIAFSSLKESLDKPSAFADENLVEVSEGETSLTSIKREEKCQEELDPFSEREEDDLLSQLAESRVSDLPKSAHEEDIMKIE